MKRSVAFVMGAVLAGSPVAGQEWGCTDPVLQRIWREGMSNSQVERLAQVRTDSLGPRLTGAP